MRAFAEAWPDGEFVQQAVALIPWGHNLVLPDKLPSPEIRKWYAAKALQHIWSRNVLSMQIGPRLLEQSGAAAKNPDRPHDSIAQGARLESRPREVEGVRPWQASRGERLLVNDTERLTISRNYRDAVRSSIHKLRNLGPDEWPKQIASIEGKIAHIARYNPGPAARLRRYLSSVTNRD